MVRPFVMLWAAVALLVTLYPSQGLAQICGPQDYDSEQAPNFDCPSPEEEALVPRLQPPPSVPVPQGETVTAEWAGVLVHRDRLILNGLKISALRRLRWVDRLHLAGRYQIEIEHARATGAIRETLLEERVDYYQGRATTAERATRHASAWYRSFGFGLVIGFVAAGLLVALSVYVGVAL